MATVVVDGFQENSLEHVTSKLVWKIPVTSWRLDHRITTHHLPSKKVESIIGRFQSSFVEIHDRNYIMDQIISPAAHT